MSTIISVEHLSKKYRLGQISSGTLSHDLNIWWARMRGKPNPLLKVGEDDKSEQHGQTLWALNDVSFHIQQAEVLGIIGRNGAGKSTLLKILSRVTAPTAGVIKLKGRVASLLEVGTGFHPEMTGRENVFLNGAILGMNRKEIAAKFDEIVDFAELDKFIDTPVKRYSSGMYVRLAFAVAAHLEPEILVIDEVLAVGDAAFQKKCLGKMGTVAKQGRTVLFVSHNMAMVRKLCSKSLLLDKGRMVLIDDTEQVINRYLNSYTIHKQSDIALPEDTAQVSKIGKALRLQIKDSEGNLRTQFKIGEPWLLRLEFEVYRSLSHAIAGVGFISVEGVSLMTLWSKPAKLKPGHYYAEFLCDMPLRSMRISLTVGLSEHERSFYYIQDAGCIDIVSISNAEQPFRTTGKAILLGNQNAEIRPLAAQL